MEKYHMLVGKKSLAMQIFVLLENEKKKQNMKAQSLLSGIQ